MRNILTPQFFNRDPVIVARDLIGKFLVRDMNGIVVAKMIIETEAYGDALDLASHARFGITSRNKIMYGSPGAFYVYLIYGTYWMLNVVCSKKGVASAVLLRGVEDYNGPGKLTKSLKIDQRFNGLGSVPQSGLWFEDREFKVGSEDLIASKRVGIEYAGESKHKLWNFAFKTSI